MKQFIWKPEGMFEVEHGAWLDITQVDARLAAKDAECARLRAKTLESRKETQRLRHVLEFLVAAGHCTYADIEAGERALETLKPTAAKEPTHGPL